MRKSCAGLNAVYSRDECVSIVEWTIDLRLYECYSITLTIIIGVGPKMFVVITRPILVTNNTEESVYIMITNHLKTVVQLLPETSYT